MIQVALGLCDFVSLNPFSAIFLRNSHLDSIFVDALDDSTVAFEWSSSNRDRLSNFEIFIFSSKCWFWTSFHGISAASFDILGHNCAIISFFDSQPTGFIKLWIEQKEIITIDMFDFTPNSLNNKKNTS